MVIAEVCSHRMNTGEVVIRDSLGRKLLFPTMFFTWEELLRRGGWREALPLFKECKGVRVFVGDEDLRESFSSLDYWSFVSYVRYWLYGVLRWPRELGEKDPREEWEKFNKLYPHSEKEPRPSPEDEKRAKEKREKEKRELLRKGFRIIKILRKTLLLVKEKPACVKILRRAESLRHGENLWDEAWEFIFYGEDSLYTLSGRSLRETEKEVCIMRKCLRNVLAISRGGALTKARAYYLGKLPFPNPEKEREKEEEEKRKKEEERKEEEKREREKQAEETWPYVGFTEEDLKRAKFERSTKPVYMPVMVYKSFDPSNGGAKYHQGGVAVVEVAASMRDKFVELINLSTEMDRGMWGTPTMAIKEYFPWLDTELAVNEIWRFLPQEIKDGFEYNRIESTSKPSVLGTDERVLLLAPVIKAVVKKVELRV